MGKSKFSIELSKDCSHAWIAYEWFVTDDNNWRLGAIYCLKCKKVKYL